MSDQPRMLARQAVFLGKNADFQEWAAKRMQPGAVASEEIARSYILAMCGIKSRAELNHSEAAAKKFEDMQSRYRRSLTV